MQQHSIEGYLRHGYRRGLYISSLHAPEYTFYVGYKWVLANVNMTRGKVEKNNYLASEERERALYGICAIQVGQTHQEQKRVPSTQTCVQFFSRRLPLRLPSEAFLGGPSHWPRYYECGGAIILHTCAQRVQSWPFIGHPQGNVGQNGHHHFVSLENMPYISLPHFQCFKKWRKKHLRCVCIIQLLSLIRTLIVFGWFVWCGVVRFQRTNTIKTCVTKRSKYVFNFH